MKNITDWQKSMYNTFLVKLKLKIYVWLTETLAEFVKNVLTDIWKRMEKNKLCLRLI